MQAPLRMERIIPHVVALGVGRIFITSGKKVSKNGKWEREEVGGGEDQTFFTHLHTYLHAGIFDYVHLQQVEKSYWGSHLLREPVSGV